MAFGKEAAARVEATANELPVFAASGVTAKLEPRPLLASVRGRRRIWEWWQGKAAVVWLAAHEASSSTMSDA